MRLKTFALAIADGVKVSAVKLWLGKTEIRAEMKLVDQRALMTFPDPIHVTPQNDLHVALS